VLQVARESAKQIICDVEHAANVKEKLRLLLTSEVSDVAHMLHDGMPTDRSIDEEGHFIINYIVRSFLKLFVVS
jgi:hypothetical protein